MLDGLAHMRGGGGLPVIFEGLWWLVSGLPAAMELLALGLWDELCRAVREALAPRKKTTCHS